MNIEEVKKLRAAWIAKGNPPCDHPKTVRERFMNSEKTGDMACTTCGDTWWRG